MQPRRARGDIEVRVARSAAHGAEGINTRLNIAPRRGAPLGPKSATNKCLEEELYLATVYLLYLLIVSNLRESTTSFPFIMHIT